MAIVGKNVSHVKIKEGTLFVTIIHVTVTFVVLASNPFVNNNR